MPQPLADPLGGLTDRNARVAVSDQNDVVEAESVNLTDDVLHMRLLTGRYAPLVREARQCQRIRAVARRAQQRDHFIPRPRSEPCSCGKYVVHHARTLAEGSDNPLRPRAPNSLTTPRFSRQAGARKQVRRPAKARQA
ncbi:hypothetical protein SRIMM317S_05868 [Streptomyces rimosus subsp. rimosus]